MAWTQPQDCYVYKESFTGENKYQLNLSPTHKTY